MGIAERKEREKEQRRQQIIDAAEKVFFQYGFEAASMDMVAEAAELSKATLYSYFNSKEELYFNIFKRGEAILMGFIEKAMQNAQAFPDKLLASLKAVVRFKQKYKKYFDVMEYFMSVRQQKPEIEALMKEHLKEEQSQLRIWSDLFEEGQKQGLVREDVNPLRCMIVIWLMFTGFLQRYQLVGKNLKRDFGLNEDELLEEAYQLILNGVLKK